MAKQRLPVAVLAIAFFVFLVIPAVAESAGLGVSDLDLKTTLTIDETKQFQVARVYNTGDLDLNMTATWVPEYVASLNVVELTPNTLYLAKGESTPIYMNVVTKELGTYSGHVDFSCTLKLQENQTGSPSIPGGRAHATFKVAEESVQPTMPLPPTIIIIAEIAVVALGMAGLLVWYHGRKGQKLPHRKIRFCSPSPNSEESASRFRVH